MRRFFQRLRKAEAEGSALAPASGSSRILAFAGIFLSWWILTACVYQHTKINFLRAESGWYLFLSHSAPDVQHRFEKMLVTKSIKGHYAPLGFLAEFETAKLAGTHAGFWKWRQITVLALLATTLFVLVRNSGYALQLAKPKANLAAIGLTSVLIFQAQMRHFVAWPFMILQLFWLLLTVTALLGLVQTARRPAETKWPWLAAGAAYGSLQFLGLGMATVAGAAAAFGAIFLGSLDRRSAEAPKIVGPFLSMIALAALHAIVSVKLLRVEDISAAPAWQFISFLRAFFGFIPNFAFGTLRTLFSTSVPAPSAAQIAQDWPYGLALLLGLGFLISAAFLRCRNEPTTANRARFVLQTFASISFLTMTALAAVRQWHEPSVLGFADYLTGSRYLIPGTFALAGLMSEVLFLFASAPILLGVLLNAGFGLCAVIGQLHYAAEVYPTVYPRSMISHASAWQSVVTMARECRKADLAIPNIPLGVLTQEFGSWDLKLFEPLLRAELNLPPGTNLEFRSWPGATSELPNEYDREVPTLPDVRKKLWLQAKRE